MRATLFMTALGVWSALTVGVGSQTAAWRDPSPHQVRSITVDSSVRLEILDWGGSGPPAVLLACYVSTHVYDDFAPKLTNQFHVYGITRRGIGASDKPATGYTVQRSANDVLEVFDSLKIEKALLVGHSCAGQVLTLFAAQHSDRLLGLVYLDGASDPTMTPADVGMQLPDPATLPRSIRPPSTPDTSSFEALRASQIRDRGWAFPEGELRQQYVANADGSVGRAEMSPTIRRAITFDARIKPDYSGIRVPVVAIYQKEPPFEQYAAAGSLITNEQQRAALRQEYDVTRAMYERWQRDLRASVPTARIVELVGAGLYMFQTAEADVLREIRAFAQEKGKDQYILAAGRRLPYLYVISLDAALDPANDGTSKAIVSRHKVAADAVDGRLLGDPANLAVSEDGRSVYVVNHHGAIDNATFRQHGGRGQIAVLDVDDLLAPGNDRTANALRRHMDSGGFGALGIVLLPDMLVIANAENHLSEDGGNRITFVERRTGSLRGVVELALGSPGFPCPDYPVPYVPPYGPPKNLTVRAPDQRFGCFPNPNGLALGRASNGSAYVFSANGGTNDVSVIDLARALRGDTAAEIGRIPMQVGPWGITATPNGRHVIVANGGSQRDGSAGNTISFVDVDRAAAGAAGAEVARILVGTSDRSEQTHPLIPTVTPDSRDVIVPNVRANNVSIVSIERALAGAADAEVARIALTRSDGQPARPRGSAITSDGRYAVISGGPSSPPFSQELGHLYVIDLRSRRLVATVTGVGHEPYALAVVNK
jgi:pimeloyl-ACP methyl ester carboxylesterase/DNA-binding beta-propeller fold protein YncE